MFAITQFSNQRQASNWSRINTLLWCQPSWHVEKYLKNREYIMKKVIQKKGTAVFWGIIFIGIIVFAIINKESFFIETSHFDFMGGSLDLKKVKEVEPRIVLIFLFTLITSLIMFVHSLLWKLEYDDVSFSLDNEDIHNLEYKKIVSIVHYKAHAYRHSIDKFIISYIGMSEFGCKEEIQKSVIKYYKHNSEMKDFFSFVSERNPDIDFHLERADSDGVILAEFDYFSKDFREDNQTEF